MTGFSGDGVPDDRTTDRRTVLAALAGTGVASLAGCPSGLDGSGGDRPTTELSGERARDLAERFAPTLYFDEREQWFPTDPRPYESDEDGATVVDGFDALNGYVERAANGDGPPDPTVFYHAVTYDGSPLAAVQFWLYSAFDQFTTNFHWHDWEVLHVFVDTDAGEPQLYVASSHSRSVPNNEFLDPAPDQRPRVLSELGSHSSALSLNETRDRFERFPGGATIADVTNSTIDRLEAIADIPFAYGLPRDEGATLPFLVPELDGQPLYDHEKLPSVDRDDLLDESLTVRSFDALTAPPTDLPRRATGTVLAHERRDEPADHDYELVSTGAVEHVSAFTGPQLSFEFAVPAFAEDAVASHITTASTPWKSPRYDDPLADVTDPRHRKALADRYDGLDVGGPVSSVLAAVTDLQQDPDAPDGAGVTTVETTVEAVALLESDPVAVPTFAGVAAVRDVPDGDHRLTVNRAGTAPHSETVSVASDDGPAVAGVDGEIPLVANGRATKLEVDTRNADSDLTTLAVEDDFAGRLYDAPLSGPDAVYVHRDGAYTTELRDESGAIGAVRVNPGTERRVRIDRPRTGKASLATYLADLAAGTKETVDEATGGTETPSGSTTGGRANAVRGLTRALAALADAAERAAARAEAGDRAGANQRLQAVQTAIARVATRLSEARDALPADVGRAVDNRLDQARRRAKQARTVEKL